MNARADDAPPTDPRLEALAAAVAAGFPRAVADLARLVRIPSVSWDGFDPAHVAASAEAVRELVAATGVFESVSIATAPLAGSSEHGQPAVLATRRARNGKPTVLLYAHHDVQPPGADDDWSSAPFEPTVRDGRLYGRGAADDKAGVLTHVAAIRALVDVVGDDLDIGLAVFIEGEEEFGSRSFAEFLAEHHDELAADAIIVADSGNWSTTVPALTVSLRGNVAFKLRVTTLEHASHSGMFGGAVPDAMLAMTRLLASFHDADGAVAVEGLASTSGDAPDYPVEQVRAETGLVDGATTIGRGDLLSRLWWQPAVTVTGIDAPSVQNASNTLVPTVTAKVSVRVAPGQSADDALEALRAHVARHTPFGARVEILDVDRGEPFLVDTSGPIVAEAERAMRDAWDEPPVRMGVGGSIPFIAELVERFPSAQILITGVEDPDSRAHSPDESLDLGVFRRGILAEALLLARLDDA